MTQSSILKSHRKAQRFVSRRFAQIPFESVCYETDAPPTPPKDERKEKELLDKIHSLINQSLATRATTAELARISADQAEFFRGVPLEQLRAMADDTTGTMAILARQGLEIQRLNTQISQSGKVVDMSLRGQIKTWLDSTDKDSGKKVFDLAADIIGGSKRGLPPLEIRAVASPMLVSTVNATTSPYIGRTEVEGGINDFLRVQPNFWDYIKKGRTNSPTYVWINKTNAQGAAAFIGPGVAKPGVSFELVAENSIAKKIADSAKTGTELLQDIDGMATFIEDELRYKVMIKMNEQLMVGVSSSTNPAGIKTLSIPFPAGTGLTTTNANTMDAIRAVIGYMRSGLLVGAITVFMNPIDTANMDMAKATSSGVYQIPPFVTASGRQIAGATIVEDYNIPQGSFQAAFLQYYRILIYKDFTITWGWENDDFTKNLVTAVGEMRIHQFFNSIYTGAFIFDTFANVIAEIDAP